MSLTVKDRNGITQTLRTTQNAQGEHTLEVSDTSLPLTAFGDLRIAELHPIFQQSFEYTVANTELTTNTVVDGGTVTQADAMAVVNTSATTASSACLQSKNHAKYRAGQGGLSRFTALFTTPVAATEQLTGLADELGSSVAFKNGYMIGYLGEVFGFHRFVNDAVVTVPIADWDDPLDGEGNSRMKIVLTNLNVFEIQFQYLGAGAVTIMVEDEATGNFVKAHTVLYANKNTVPSTYNPNFHHTIFAANKGTTADLTIKTSSFAYFTEGKTDLIQLHQPQFSSDVQEDTSVTTEVAIFTIRNRAAYASKTNFIDVILERVSAAIEASSANNLGTIRVVKNTTLGGTPSWSDINTSDSIVEIDTSGTTVTGGKVLAFFPLAGKNDKVGETITDLKIILAPGDSITVSGFSANSATIGASILWKELF